MSSQPIYNNSEASILRETVSHHNSGLVNHILSQEKGNKSMLKDGARLPKKRKWTWRENKKGTLKQVTTDCCDNAKTTTDQLVKMKLDEGSGGVRSTKRKREKKMEITEKGNSSDSAVGFKPLIIIRKPEDYSANWKQLKEIIAPGNEKSTEIWHPGKNQDRSMNECKHKEGNIKKYKGIKKGDSHRAQKEKTGDNNKKKKEKMEIWFDNVDPVLLEEDEEDSESKDFKGKSLHEKAKDESCDKSGNSGPLVKSKSFNGTTKVIAMDCEMVGTGVNGKDSILARVSIVNIFGKVLYDKFVKPTEKVTDYRTNVSGVRPADLEEGSEFSVVQKEVSDLLEGRILVGHGVHHDLKVLFLSHPRYHIRDTSRYKRFRSLFGGKTPSLKKLTEKILSVQIQHGEHNSVQDAQAAMRLYTMNRREWELFSPRKRSKLNSKKRMKASATLTKKESSDEVED